MDKASSLESVNSILEKDPGAKVKQFKKGAILLKKGETALKSFYVKKGLLRGYIIDKKGKEHIFVFAPEGWVISDIESQEFDHPAELYIDCLEDSEVLIFDRNYLTLESLNKEDALVNFKLLYRRMGVLQRRVLMLMSSPAIERYNHFTETYPELSSRVPQHMIAAYLGITPQALSTIRSKST